MNTFQLVMGYCVGVANAVEILVAQAPMIGMRHFWGIGIYVCLGIEGLAVFIITPMSQQILF